jgi:hypothetical protein
MEDLEGNLESRPGGMERERLSDSILGLQGGAVNYG